MPRQTARTGRAAIREEAKMAKQAQDSSTAVTVVFALERETKNTVRYLEQVEDGQAPAVGTLYVQKAALSGFGGFPEALRVTLEAGA